MVGAEVLIVLSLHTMVSKYGLRPLVSVDAGWNSQIAVNNIEKL